MKYNKILGAYGEEIACKYLESVGYKILERNFSCKVGELDIIAFDKDTLAFVEVKSRTSIGYGNPSEAVSFTKQRRIVQSSLFYMTKNKMFDYMSRFDVIEIMTEGTNKDCDINLIKNAFQYSGKYGY